MYDEYDDGEEGGASLGRKLALLIGLVAIAAAGFFAFKAVTDDGDGGQAVGPRDSASAAGSSDPTTTDETTSTSATGVMSAEGTTEPVSSDAATTTAAAATTTTEAAATTTVAAAAPPATAAPATAAPAAPAAPAVPYETLPDGSPAWVIALFGADRVTITGVVPDEAARETLSALASANAKPEQAGIIDNQVTINPAVPRNVGVRVVELTSARFPPGTADILPAHAAELDRVANIMTALPNITALVIGHADQRGEEATNYAISEARANAVRTYLTGRGIAPSRLSSRAVGEADLLSLADDDSALALNRRTEFVFFGLLL